MVATTCQVVHLKTRVGNPGVLEASGVPHDIQCWLAVRVVVIIPANELHFWLARSYPKGRRLIHRHGQDLRTFKGGYEETCSPDSTRHYMWWSQYARKANIVVEKCCCDMCVFWLKFGYPFFAKIQFGRKSKWQWLYRGICIHAQFAQITHGLACVRATRILTSINLFTITVLLIDRADTKCSMLIR